ncbi:hypothetical protein [Amycolatopsis sp. NPDC051371]|uniref:hypothetical protein n=1 Tax=Amycolatopsis sp. NPDC051371 TaxID=3155800 RepID=UPI00341273FB
MITKFSDLTEAERGVLVGAAREEAADQVGARRARWHEIADAIEHAGKQPHSVKPGAGWQPLPQPDAGTGGPC